MLRKVGPVCPRGGYMQYTEQLVTIKGTKEGFVFELDDKHLLTDVIAELRQKLTQEHEMDEAEQAVSAIVKLGYRYVSDDEREHIRALIERSNRFHIKRFDMEVITKTAANNLLHKTDIKLETKIVRSGQVLDVTGDLLLVGDVNPGGEVRATGNVFILGNLEGIAHAGKNGDEEAVIIASYMNPSQLRIGKYFSRAPDYESTGVYMECGFYDETKQQIIIDRLQVLPSVRKKLRNLERRIMYG